MMELEQLRVFVAVAQTRTFVEAAARLNKSQPAVTMTVKALEREMGVPLFAREGRGKRLTAAGARLAAKAAGILEGARRLKEDVAGVPEVPRGAVRVGAGEAAIVYFLLPLLRRIREAYPSLALEVRNQRDMESFDQLLAGELDLAVRSREALPHGLRFEPLFASGRMLIVPTP